MADVNRALLAKLVWKLACNKERPWIQLLYHKYCNILDFWEVSVKSSDCLVWKGILSAKGKCGIAGIFRDDLGSILLLTFKSDIATSPLEAECMAIQMVLITALEKGWSRMTVESDATPVVHALKSGKPPP
ncbi:hypothetical protein TorRG33x02_197460 [Trema orientale]|uniref:RNase H type-1 domain-containing protein n=1 Tax=Trema orientale TaxID=63057 RepID=A0A2P5EFU2_TREOI|nr:hypothetical protein TorRG33x02_197460 [Trema orientale]